LPSAKWAYKLSAVCAEAFCRHSFGQRYAPWLLGSFLFCFAITSLFRAVAPEQTSRLLDIYLLTFFILTLFHLGSMWRPRALPTHTYSTGRSWSFWRRLQIPYSVVQTVVEPGLHVLAGLLVFREDNLLSLWLQLAGFSLFVKEVIGNWRRRNRLFDALDARAEGERMNEAIRRHTAPQTAGERVASAVVAAQQEQAPPAPLAQIVRNLDPGLRRLIEPPNPNIRTQAPYAQPQNTPSPRRYQAGPPGTLPRVTSRKASNFSKKQQ
jgi:hypothetical protein